MSRPPAAPAKISTAIIATLRYQGAESVWRARRGMMRPVGVIEQRDDDRHRRGHQRHPQVLHDRDDAVVTAEFAGDRDKAGRAAGHQGQRTGQRADVAVQPEQCACDDAQHQRGDGDDDHDRPIRTQSAHRVAMRPSCRCRRRAHPGRRCRPGGVRVAGASAGSASAMPTTSAANSAAEGTPTMVSGTVTAMVTAANRAHLATCCSRCLITMTSMPLTIFACNSAFWP